MTTTEVQAHVPVALLCGSFIERLEKAMQLGYADIKLIILHPTDLEGADIAAQVSGYGLEIAAIAGGVIAMLDRLTLLGYNPKTCAAVEQRLNQLIDFAAATRAASSPSAGSASRRW